MGDFFKYKKYLKTFFKIKNSINIFLESAITNVLIDKNIDLIVPISNFIENFNIYKTYQGFTSKSLFVKFGPWLSKNILIYLSILMSIKIFPYFWLLKLNNFNIKIIYLNICTWLTGLSKIFVFKKKQFFLYTFMHNITTFNKTKSSFNINFITKTNFWNSNLSFIQSSKYVKLGFNLYKKTFKTFQML